MKNISETLMEVKTIQSDLLRAIEVREEVITKALTFKVWETEKKTAKQLEQLEEDFVKDKSKRLTDINKKINGLKKQLLDLKHKVNQKNIELGIDNKILEVKWLRIELSKLMIYITKKNYFSGSGDLSTEHLEKIGLLDTIKGLEDKKRKLDADIQSINQREKL